jgi:PncC family amidohydrolase
VSEQTALEMARGAMRKSGADIGLSTTGIAGPSGAGHDKPVGLVYIGYCDKDGATAKRFMLPGDRERVRNMSVLNALARCALSCCRVFAGSVHHLPWTREALWEEASPWR